MNCDQSAGDQHNGKADESSPFQKRHRRLPAGPDVSIKGQRTLASRSKNRRNRIGISP
jgi:hypothetical protein